MFRVPPVTAVPADPPDPVAVPPPLLHAARVRLATATRVTAASRFLAIGPPPGLDRAEARTTARGSHAGHRSVKNLSPGPRGRHDGFMTAVTVVRSRGERHWGRGTQPSPG